MVGLPWQDVSYCSYGYPYRKLTRIWGNLPWAPERPLCGVGGYSCEQSREQGRHPEVAQRGTFRRKGEIVQNCHTQGQLYSIPPDLCRDRFCGQLEDRDFALAFSRASTLACSLGRGPVEDGLELLQVGVSDVLLDLLVREVVLPVGLVSTISGAWPVSLFWSQISCPGAFRVRLPVGATSSCAKPEAAIGRRPWWRCS